METCDVVVVGAGHRREHARDCARRRRARRARARAEPRVRGPRARREHGAVGRRRSTRLGVEQTLLDAGAHVAAKWFNYHLPDQQRRDPGRDDGARRCRLDEPPPPRRVRRARTGRARARAQPCTAARATSTSSSATDPRVRWNDADGAHEVACRHRGRRRRPRVRVRKALGLELERAPVLNHIAGLLLSGLEIDDSADFIAGEGELFMAGFHQGGGRARVYLCPRREPSRPLHRRGQGRTLPVRVRVRMPAVRQASSRTGRRPGRWRRIPATTRGSTVPSVAGAVLIADAAGYSNPIIGQGLSIAMRDARIVPRRAARRRLERGRVRRLRDERKERMRRLRFIANTVAITEAEDADNREARRAKWGELMATDERAFLVLAERLRRARDRTGRGIRRRAARDGARRPDLPHCSSNACKHPLRRLQPPRLGDELAQLADPDRRQVHEHGRVAVVVRRREELLRIRLEQRFLLAEVGDEHDEPTLGFAADAEEYLSLTRKPGVPYHGFSVVSGSESAIRRTSSSVATAPASYSASNASSTM